MKMRSSIIGALALAAMPALTWAGGTAVIMAGTESENMTTTIEFDGDRLRMGVDGMDAGGYMVMRDGTMYSVIDQGDGQPLVMDLGAMAGMFGGMLENMESQISLEAPIENLISIESAGRREQVAGINGQVFNVTFIDEDGQRTTEEVVIGNHRALRELSQSMEAWSRGMARSLNTDIADYEASMAPLLEHGDGILRMGDFYRLVSIDDSTPPASRFELPAAPQQMPDFASLISGALSGAEQAQQQQPQQQTSQQNAPAEASNPVSNFFNRRVQRQQDRVEDRAEEEINQADRAVDSAVDRAIDSIFRRF